MVTDIQKVGWFYRRPCSILGNKIGWFYQRTKSADFCV